MTYTWIELRLRELKKKKKELGIALGLPPSRISDIIKGNRRIQSQEISRLSAFLNMDATTVLKNIQEQSNDIELHSTTEQITVIGNKNTIGNNYDVWPADQQYIITLPRHTRYGELKKIALEEICPPSNTIKLYICVQENPAIKRVLEGLLQLEASVSSNTAQPNAISVTQDNGVVFVIAFYEQN